MDSSCGTLWCDYVNTQFDPAHLLSELGFTLVFEALQLLLIALLWKKVVKPRWFSKAHADFDEAHGITHEPDDTARKIQHLRDLAKLAEEDDEWGTVGWLNAVEDGLIVNTLIGKKD